MSVRERLESAFLKLAEDAAAGRIDAMAVIVVGVGKVGTQIDTGEGQAIADLHFAAATLTHRLLTAERED